MIKRKEPTFQALASAYFLHEGPTSDVYLKTGSVDDQIVAVNDYYYLAGSCRRKIARG